MTLFSGCRIRARGEQGSRPRTPTKRCPDQNDVDASRGILRESNGPLCCSRTSDFDHCWCRTGEQRADRTLRSSTRRRSGFADAASSAKYQKAYEWLWAGHHCHGSPHDEIEIPVWIPCGLGAVARCDAGALPHRRSPVREVCTDLMEIQGGNQFRGERATIRRPDPGVATTLLSGLICLAPPIGPAQRDEFASRARPIARIIVSPR